MHSIMSYGRIIARAVVSSLNEALTRSNVIAVQPIHNVRELRLISAASGISKGSDNPSFITTKFFSKFSFGDDAFFIGRHKIADVLGVADGVGGWRTYGVDPSLFPKSLMSTCERLVNSGKFQPASPVDIISAGYDELLESKEPIIGSCTACVVSLHKTDKTLYTANLGDSGVLVIRDGQIVHRSHEQQHYFNTPFQLSIAPSLLDGVVISDEPDSAHSSSFGVKDGDIIVLGTDGLFDNMTDELILKHVNKLKNFEFENVQRVANMIVQHARKLSLDAQYMSPFALNAAASGFNITGGKPDDITVLLARVTAVPGEVT